MSDIEPPDRGKDASEPAEFQYDVALSFAGEDRGFVERVATILRESDVKLFYDDYVVVELWGQNLFDVFEEVYSRRSRYAVLFVSRHYVAKPWPRHERHSAQARALVETSPYVLPVVLDDSELPGMPSTVAHVDGRRLGPDGVAELIIDKVGAASSGTDLLELLALGVPRTSEEIMRLLALRPPYWEYRLHAGLLLEGKRNAEPKWRDHRLGLVRPNGDTKTNQEAMQALSSVGVPLAAVENIERLMRPTALEDAFGRSGEPGDPEAIEHHARRFMEVYEQLLDWAATTRSLQVSNDLRRVRDITSTLADNAINEIREFVDQLVADIDRIPHLLTADDDSPVTMTFSLVVTVADETIQEHAAEMQRLHRIIDQ